MADVIRRAKELISSFQSWAMEAGTRRVLRPWCLLGFDGKLLSKEIASFFDRTELAKQYAARYNERDPLKKRAHSYLQIEINLIYGFQKAFVTRHKTRMQIYRDDSSQKAVHCRRNITKAFSWYENSSAKAEQ